MCPCIDSVQDILCCHAEICLGTATEGIYLMTKSDGDLFKPSRLKTKSKVQKCLHDFLFTDDAAVTVRSANNLQQLMDHGMPRFWANDQPEENKSWIRMVTRLPVLLFLYNWRLFVALCILTQQSLTYFPWILS